MKRAAAIRIAIRCAAAIAPTACATIALTPAGQAVVPVALESENSSAVTAAIGGCSLVATHESVDLTELDLANEIPPFVRERNRAAADGANVLLARTRVLVPRGFECPAASPITDCPPLEEPGCASRSRTIAVPTTRWLRCGSPPRTDMSRVAIRARACYPSPRGNSFRAITTGR